jgi:predicted phage terminase large subunit-like protein
MPPGSAKSTYASMLTPPYYLQANPKNLVIGSSHGQELSDRFGRKVRNIVGSEDYNLVFDIELARDSKAAGRWETSVGGEYYAVGVGGSVTGRRADLAIIDDPVKGRSESDSLLIRDKAWDWYLSDLRTRLKPGAAIVLIQTRWNFDDLAGRILPEDYDFTSGTITARDGEEWYVLCLPALAEEDDILGRRPGASIWPEWFSQEMLEQERLTQGPRNWASLYQQRPVPEEGDFFKDEWFRWYDELPKHLHYYGASDYAVTDGGGDYTVHGVIGVDADDNIYVVDWWREQTESDVWIETLIDLGSKYNTMAWGEEGGQIIKSLGPFIDKRQRERKEYFYRTQYASTSDKPSRARSIQARMSMGKVYFPKHASWLSSLTGELLQFPAGVHDDQVDVMSLFGRMLADMIGKKPPKKKSDVWKEIQTRKMTVDELIKANAKGRK